VINAGTRLGPYEIVAAIGAGGMGEVYRARDTRLSREVALKVLPSEVSADPDRLRRFEQEARAASALNHPNIVVVYDVGRSNSISFIAMEWVQGKSLRDLMISGPLAIRKLLPLATQLAEGLARAHAAAIVHRDLKPENVMVSEDGFVKILDFGLAKLALTSADKLSVAPTAVIEAPRTEAGTVLGTVGYMSPEQAAGREVDYRSDQFSFGAILYEMVTGRRAFRGDSAAETLAAIIREEPEPLASVRPEVPSPLGWVIERCLAKEPAERYESTRDLARDLATLRDRVASASLAGLAAGTLPRRIARSGRIAWAAAALATLAALVLAVVHFRQRPSRPPPVRFLVSPPEKATLSSDEPELHNLAVSPDGSRIAFVASLEGQSRIWVRPLDALSATPLAGSEGASSPFWSPGGAILGFFADGKLKTIAVTGGPAQTVCPTAGANTGAWGRTGTILFTQAFSPKDGLYSVPASGGEPRQITADSGDFSGGRWPRFLPDGRRFLFLSWSAKDKTKFLASGELGSTEIRRVAPLKSRVEISGAGDLFYVREGVLVATAFDSSRLRFAGEAVPVAERIPYFSPTGWAPFSVSENGVVAYQAGAVESPLRWLDRKGQTVATLGPPGEYSSVRLSPDGRKAAVEKIDPATGLSDLWIADLSRGVMTRFTADPGSESSPVWSPDGAEIAFVSHGVASPTLRRKRLDDSSGGEILVKEGFPTPTDWSRDGRIIAYHTLGPKTGFDMWLLPLSGDRKPYPLRQTPFNEGVPTLSPDGRWVAFLSDESAVLQMYVMSSSGSGPKWQVSSGGGVALGRPRWRGDSKEIFHVAADRQLMSVPVKTDAGNFEPGSSVPLFRIDSKNLGGYDVSADGHRFLTSSGAGLGSQPIAVILNWPSGRSR